MSIILEGIDMPKDGDRIYLLIEGDKCFNALDPIQTLAEAIQIPKDHGRLIDADLFKELIKDSVPSWAIGVKIPTYGDMDIMDKIYCIPTILEAEE